MPKKVRRKKNYYNKNSFGCLSIIFTPLGDEERTLSCVCVYVCVSFILSPLMNWEEFSSFGIVRGMYELWARCVMYAVSFPVAKRCSLSLAIFLFLCLSVILTLYLPPFLSLSLSLYLSFSPPPLSLFSLPLSIFFSSSLLETVFVASIIIIVIAQIFLHSPMHCAACAIVYLQRSITSVKIVSILVVVMLIVGHIQLEYTIRAQFMAFNSRTRLTWIKHQFRQGRPHSLLLLLSL